jgi:hypothetical protein
VVLIPVSLGAAYGFFGGALYERWKCRRIAALVPPGGVPGW